MRRGPQSTLMEFFPPNVFNRDWETVVQSMGIRYVAWQGNQLRFTPSSLPLQGRAHSRGSLCANRKYFGENLPGVTLTATYEDFALDAQAVVRAISEELDRGA